MRYGVIELIKKTESVDSIGQSEYTETRRKVFCRVESVSGAEWFQGGQNGIKPEFKFIIFFGDYSDEVELEFKGTVYSIYRTYTDGDDFELYAERKVGC